MALLDEISPLTLPEGTAYQPIDPKDVRWPDQPLDDATALKMVVQDTNKAEGWMYAQNVPLEWMRADRLYLFQVPIQYWEGTNPPIPRAHLGMPLVYEHIESILPQIVTGLFNDDPPFAIKPRPGTRMDAARALQHLLGWELDQVDFQEEIRLGTKYALVYGTGVWKWGWKTSTRKRTTYQRVQPNQQVLMPGGAFNMPGSDQLKEIEVDEEVNQPTFEHVNIRHILVDPTLRVPDIRKATFVTHKLYWTIADLDQLRDYEGYRIPERSALIKAVFPPKEKAPLDTPSNSNYNLNNEFAPAPRGTEPSVDPITTPLEVLEYWTKDRVITVVQRKLVIRNEPNEFGVIPFVSVAYSDVLDSFWGMGVAKLVGGEQRMQQGVMNAFLDDLSLSLNGMFKRVRGSNTPQNQLRSRPGGVIDTDDKDGIELLARQPIDPGVFAVFERSDARAQRRTAANEMVVQGSLPADKSSITRTATGVSALTGGTGTRLQYLVENIGRQVFVPVLQAFHEMSKKKLKPSQISVILSQELGQAYAGDTVELANARVDFEIVAASKVQARRATAQTLPFIFQTVLTEPVMEALAQEGKKVNIGELVKMAFDVSGWPNKDDVIVDMSQQDQARMAMNNPAVQQAMLQQQKSQTDQSNVLEQIQEEGITRVGRDYLKLAFDKAFGDNEPNSAPAKAKK